MDLDLSQPGTPRKYPLELVEGSIQHRPSWWEFRDRPRTLLFRVLSSRQEMVPVRWPNPPPEAFELRCGDRVALVGSWRNRVFRVRDVAAPVETFF